MASPLEERPPYAPTLQQLYGLLFHPPQHKDDFVVAALNRSDTARLSLERLIVDFEDGFQPSLLLKVGELRSNPAIVIWMRLSDGHSEKAQRKGLYILPTFWSRQLLPEAVWIENWRSDGASLAAVRETCRREREPGHAGRSRVFKDWETAKVYKWSRWHTNQVWFNGGNTVKLNVNPWWNGNESIRPITPISLEADAYTLQLDYLIWLWTQHASTEQMQDLKDRGYRVATQGERYVRSEPHRHIETIRYDALGLRNDYYSIHPTPITDNDIWVDFDSRPADYDLDQPAVLERIQVAFARTLRWPAPEKDALMAAREESWLSRYTATFMQTSAFRRLFRNSEGQIRLPYDMRRWLANRQQQAAPSVIQAPHT